MLMERTSERKHVRGREEVSLHRCQEASFLYSPQIGGDGELHEVPRRGVRPDRLEVSRADIRDNLA